MPAMVVAMVTVIKKRVSKDVWQRKFPPEHGLSCRSGPPLYLSDKEEGVRVRTGWGASAQQAGLTVEETPLLGKAL